MKQTTPYLYIYTVYFIRKRRITRQFEMTCKTEMCNLQKKIKCKTNIRNSELTATEVNDSHSFFFRTGVYSSSNRNDGMLKRSSTRHHRLRVRQQTEKPSVSCSETEIKHEVWARKCHGDGFQVRKWLKCT
jgi:hypothetical protein